MSVDEPRAPEPSGPADVTLPRRALARVALSSRAAEIADLAGALVPTFCDNDSQAATEYVQLAARLVEEAQEALALAVVYARERGKSWADVGEALGVSRQTAHERYNGRINAWQDGLDRPWESTELHGVNGVRTIRSSRLPEGLSDPDFTIGYLDNWCATHLADTSTAALANDMGVADRMVSTGLPKHTTITEANSVLRTARYLTSRRNEAEPGERESFEIRKHAVLDKARAEHADTTGPSEAEPDIGAADAALTEGADGRGLVPDLGTFGADVLRRCRIALRDHDGHPPGVWSTGEQLAVALVLDDTTHLEQMDYTRHEALRRVLAGLPQAVTPRAFEAWLDHARAELAK